MAHDYWETREGRNDAMARVIAYVDRQQDAELLDAGMVGIELSVGYMERLAEELGLRSWEHAQDR
jgi:diphthamide synthase (EF-2-diphthine--ammonia ligase)